MNVKGVMLRLNNALNLFLWSLLLWKFLQYKGISCAMGRVSLNGFEVEAVLLMARDVDASLSLHDRIYCGGIHICVKVLLWHGLVVWIGFSDALVAWNHVRY